MVLVNTTGSIRCALLGLLALALAACAPTWSRVSSGDSKIPGRHFTAALPAGWLKAPSPANDLILTREGLALQKIEVVRYDFDDAFKPIKRELSDDTLPDELADLQVALLRQTVPDMKNMDVLERSANRVAGKASFALRARYYTARGLEYRADYRGFIFDGKYYLVSFTAPATYFYARDLPAFEAMVNGMRDRGCWFFC